MKEMKKDILEQKREEKKNGTKAVCELNTHARRGSSKLPAINQTLAELDEEERGDCEKWSAYKPQRHANVHGFFFMRWGDEP